MPVATALIVTRHTPRPQDDGAGALLHEMVSFLSSHGVRCHVAWLDQPRDIGREWRWRCPPELDRVCRLHFRRSLRLGRTHLFPERLPFGGRTTRRLGTWLRPEPPHAQQPVPFAGIPADVPGWFRPLDVGELAFVARLVRRLRPTAMLVNYPWLGAAFSEAGPATKVVLSYNVWHQKARSVARLSAPNRLAFLTAETERSMLHPADYVVAVSEDDRDAYAELIPASRILLVPKAVAARPAPGSEEPGLCLFLGSHNPANVAALRWLLTEVWPLVLASYPSARLRLCGRVAEGFGPLPATVENAGFVERPDPYYGAAQLVLVPLHHGGGVKIKLLEALAFGKPVVTTAIGLQGLGFLAAAMPPADDAPAFAAQIVALLQDPAARLTRATSAQQLALQRFAPGSCYGPLLAALAGPVAHACR